MTSEEPEKLPPSQGTDATAVNDTHQTHPYEERGVGESRAKRFRNVWKIWEEGQESDWWFAGTGIP